jgi:hypothetical protein
MKIDPTLLTQKLTEANVHPGFYKMLGLKGPSYKWVKRPLNEVKVGDTIKIVEYDELPRYHDGVGDPDIPEGWNYEMRRHCGQIYTISTPPPVWTLDCAYITVRGLYIIGTLRGVPYSYIFHQVSKRTDMPVEDNIFYVKRSC